MQRDTGLFTQQDLIAITGFYLCIDYQKVLLIIYSQKIVWSVAPLTHTYTQNILFQVHLVIVVICKALIIFFFAVLDIQQTGLQTHSTHDLLHGKETAANEESQIMFLHVQDLLLNQNVLSNFW